jgi:CHAT domain-containing protein
MLRLLYANVLLDDGRTPNPHLNQVSELLTQEVPNGLPGDFAARLAVARIRLARKKGETPRLRELRSTADRLITKASDPCLSVELQNSDIHDLQQQGIDRARDVEKVLAEMGGAVEHFCHDPYWKAIWLGLNAYQKVGESHFEDAKNFNERALALAQRHELKTLQPLLLGNLAANHLYLGDSERALQELSQAEEIYKETGQDFDRSIDRGRRGEILAARHEYEKAAAEFGIAREAAHSAKQLGFETRWLNELTALRIETGELAVAESLNRTALTTGAQVTKESEKEDYAVAQLHAARIALLNQDFSQASAALRQIELREGTRPSFLWRQQAVRAQFFAATRKNREARNEFMKSIQTAEVARGTIEEVWHKMTFSNQVLTLYRQYVDFLIDQGQDHEALHVVETFHARELSRKLGLVDEQKTDDFAAVARGQRATILSYWVGDKRSYMWVTTAAGSRRISLGDTRKLAVDIQNYRRQIDDRANFLTSPESSVDLFKKLIEPAGLGYSANSPLNVIVIPDGPIADLNFDTLISPERPEQYWLESISLRIAPSISLLHAKEPTKVTINSLLLVGNTNPPPPFPPLPGSKKEVDSIAELFPGKEILSLSSNDASLRRFLQSQPNRFSLIHLSAHAIADKFNPLDSSILFSPETKGGEFKLYAHTISEMKLSAELVTLSACRGAGAQAVPGEGLVGLTWAFLSAGSHQVAS